MLVCYRSRSGKEYDNIRQETVTAVMGSNEGRIDLVENDDELVEFLSRKKIHDVVCQDAQWHFSFLLEKFRVFSIALFFDTLHHAYLGHSVAHAPHMTYFASEKLRDEFVRVSGAKWNTRVLGSPTYDHSLFVDPALKFPGNVLVLAPPNDVLDAKWVEQMKDLIVLCAAQGRPVVFKDRAKSKSGYIDRSKVTYVVDEAGFPYTSMQLLLGTAVHITAYGTSAFESNFFGKPAINLPADHGAGSNHIIPSYGFDEVFDNDLCHPSTGNLIEDVRLALSRTGEPERLLTMSDNHSIDILLDIVREIG